VVQAASKVAIDTATAVAAKRMVFMKSLVVK